MNDAYTRRDFLKRTAYSASVLTALSGCNVNRSPQSGKRPNLLFVFADQWRGQATGYAGNPDVRTPHLDRLAKQSVVYSNAVSNCPVCSPFRASLITGRYPLTHGVFLNDLQLNTEAVSFAQAYRRAGYTTGYIGKWHLDGSGRSAYIPPERRQGFEYWKVLECTHNYNNSKYYAGDDPTQKTWDGYDAYAQTEDAIGYLQRRAKDEKPFALFISWGPPHAPYRTGPDELLQAYDQKNLTLRKNVPEKARQAAMKDIAGYYAHITALDECIGKLMQALAASGLEDNTIVVFTSDHGDMLHSQGERKKQRPWDESIRIPFLLRCPGVQADMPRTIEAPLSVPDIMPTLLSLSGVAIPDTCEGQDLSQEVLGKQSPPEDRDALFICAVPFGQWPRRAGGRESRGIRTKRYTYVRDLHGPWLLYDNLKDPFQQHNLAGKPDTQELQAELDVRLNTLLKKTGDRFHTASELIERCGYKVNKNETVGYGDKDHFGQVSVSCRENL